MKALSPILLLVLAFFVPVWAVDKSFSKALKHAEIRSTGSHGEGSEWIVPVMFGVMAVVLIMYFYRRFEERRRHPSVKPWVTWTHF